MLPAKQGLGPGHLVVLDGYLGLVPELEFPVFDVGKQFLSELLVRSSPDIASELIFECLIERERLGCTSLDRGAAFPHCRVDGIDTSNGALMQLSEPVDFDSADGQPVDSVFGMMVPTELADQHRADIKLVTQVSADEELRARLRSMNSSVDLYEALVDGSRPSVRATLQTAQGT